MRRADRNFLAILQGCARTAGGANLSNMTVDAIKDIRDTTPFRPFIVHTANGRGFEVTNQDSLLFAEGGQTLILVTPDQRFHILATELISSVTR